MLARMFGKRLAHYRKKRGMTQHELAERVGVTEKHYGRVERGLSAPSFLLLNALSKELGVSPAQFFLFVAERHDSEDSFEKAKHEELSAAVPPQSPYLLGTWIFDVTAKEHSWSQSLYAILGCAPDAVVPSCQQFLEYLTDDCRLEAGDWLQRALQGKACGGIAFKLYRPDNSPQPVSAAVDTVSSVAGVLERVIISFCNCCEMSTRNTAVFSSLDNFDDQFAALTTSLRAERDTYKQELARMRNAASTMEKQRNYLQAIVAARGDGYWEWDRVTGKVYISRRWKENLGYADNEIVDDISEWVTRVHPDDVAKVMQAHEELVRDPSKDRFKIEYRLRHKNGGYRWICSRTVASRDAAGWLVAVSGTDEDITDRIMLLQELETRRRNLHAVLDNIPIALFIADASGECTYVNAAWQQLTGLSRDEALGLGWIRCIHRKDREGVVYSWKEFVAREAEYKNCFRIANIKNNYVRTVKSTIIKMSCTHDAKSQFVGYVVEIENLNCLNNDYLDMLLKEELDSPRRKLEAPRLKIKNMEKFLYVQNYIDCGF